MKHKWHDEIVAWAGGAEIEVHAPDGWETVDAPKWHINVEYRIKPQDICKCQKQACPALKEKKYLYVYRKDYNLELTECALESGMGYLLLGKIEVQDD